LTLFGRSLVVIQHRFSQKTKKCRKYVLHKAFHHSTFTRRWTHATRLALICCFISMGGFHNRNSIVSPQVSVCCFRCIAISGSMVVQVQLSSAQTCCGGLVLCLLRWVGILKSWCSFILILIAQFCSSSCSTVLNLASYEAVLVVMVRKAKL